MRNMNNEYRNSSARNAALVISREIYKDRLPRLSQVEVACVDCGKRAKHYDRRDYNKPLEVQPVCQPCNCKRGKAVYVCESERNASVNGAGTSGIPKSNGQRNAPNASLESGTSPKTCKRCNHVWVSRVEHEPVRCPKCQSPYWARERKVVEVSK